MSIDILPKQFSPEIQESIVLYNVSWEAYEHLLELFSSRRLRHTYIEGTLEIMSPSKRHDRVKTLIARMFEMATYELNIPIQSIGSTTLKKEVEERGLEPDESYYVQHEAQVRDKDDYVPERDPPPDLSIEAEETRNVLDRLNVYSRLEVPELWRVSATRVRFYRLENGEYIQIDRSIAIPAIEPKILEELVAKRNNTSEHDLIKELIAWLRAKKQQ